MRIPILAVLLCTLSVTQLSLADPAPVEASRLPAVLSASSLHVDGARPTFALPLRIAPAVRGAGSPAWVEQGLVAYVPRLLFGLARSEKPGLPTYDPSAKAWFASANGSLVRLEPDGRLIVVADGFQGIDVDVRASRSMAVSREPDDAIVLHRWDGAAPARSVLLRGSAYFRPRFSPDGSRVLIAESRAGGGHVWVAGLDGTVRDLTQGNGASWHPDGRRIVFTRIRHDGEQILESELWAIDLTTGTERLVARPSIPAVDPVVSPDGSLVAFLHGQTRDVHVAAFEDSSLPGRR